VFLKISAKNLPKDRHDNRKIIYLHELQHLNRKLSKSHETANGFLHFLQIGWSGSRTGGSCVTRLSYKKIRRKYTIFNQL
jgi:exonuclease III